MRLPTSVICWESVTSGSAYSLLSRSGYYLHLNVVLNIIICSPPLFLIDVILEPKHNPIVSQYEIELSALWAFLH